MTDRLYDLPMLKCVVVLSTVNTAFFQRSGGKSCLEETGRITIRWTGKKV